MTTAQAQTGNRFRQAACRTGFSILVVLAGLFVLLALGPGRAAAAAVGWALYILLTQHVGDRFTGINGLSLSIPVAAATFCASRARASASSQRPS